MKRNIILIIALIVISGAIYAIEKNKPASIGNPSSANGGTDNSLSLAINPSSIPVGEQCTDGYCTTTPKTATSTKPAVVATGATGVPVAPAVPAIKTNTNFPAASDISTPDGFINSPNPGADGTPGTGAFSLKDFVGKKIILVDFWTYSCINCQRTLPYLNAWQEKYADQGLLIVGVHTPEFEFEKNYDNVATAVKKFDIKYPVVLDNDYSTWTSYKNRYWPRKYLIDTTGHVVYDHIGEGGYEETETEIQKLLGELHGTGPVDGGLAASAVPTNESLAQSPETYFGASRNSSVGNFSAGIATTFDIDKLPLSFDRDTLYIQGKWNIGNEFATTESDDAQVVFKYYAAKVYIVAHSASGPVNVTVKRDGVVVKTVTVDASQLYTLIDDSMPGEHTMELDIDKAGLEAYTFTFG